MSRPRKSLLIGLAVHIPGEDRDYIITEDHGEQAKCGCHTVSVMPGIFVECAGTDWVSRERAPVAYMPCSHKSGGTA